MNSSKKSFSILESILELVHHIPFAKGICFCFKYLVLSKIPQEQRITTYLRLDHFCRLFNVCFIASLVFKSYPVEFIRKSRDTMHHPAAENQPARTMGLDTFQYKRVIRIRALL